MQVRPSRLCCPSVAFQSSMIVSSENQMRLKIRRSTESLWTENIL